MRKFLTVLFLLPTVFITGQPNFDDMDQYIAKAQKDWAVPGMAVAVVKDGEVVLSKGYGTLTINSKVKVDENTLFAIASNTKAFIASALAQLVVEGKLDWKDKVIDYLPYFRLYDDYVTNNTTVEDLLCHRVGLGTFSGDLIWYKSELTAEEVIKKAQYVPQAYGFRDGYGYSNLMFITAGEVIKKVSGMEWHEYVQKAFFAPLNMSRTITSTKNLAEKGNFASPHKPLTQKQIPIEWVNWDNMGAAGGIISSVNDMAKWLNMNLNQGIYMGDTLLSSAQQNLLWTPHNNHVVSLESKKNIPTRHFSGYGLGWVLGDYNGNLLVTHGGGYDGMYSSVMMVPEQKLGIVVLTNTMKGVGYPVATWIIDQYLNVETRDWSAERLEASRKNNQQADEIREREEKRNKKTGPTLETKAYTGTYFSQMHGEVTITERNGKMEMAFKNAPALSATLAHWHYNIWQINWHETHAWFDFGTVQFLLDNNLSVDGLQFDVPNGDIFFDEVNLEKVK